MQLSKNSLYIDRYYTICIIHNIIILLIACTDTIHWQANGELNGWSCDQFEKNGYCKNGKLSSDSYDISSGQYANYPEDNCCACGKGRKRKISKTVFLSRNF